MQLATKRLLIRPWQGKDLVPFARINADPHVRHFYYPSILTPAQSNEIIAQCTQHLSDHGFAFLAMERRTDGSLIGGAGLSWTNDIPDGPHVEIGWILGRPHWRQGYAKEAGHAWLAHGWSVGLHEIVGFTSKVNTPSRSLMKSLGMKHNPVDDFADPTVPAENPLSPHVLYRQQHPARHTGSVKKY